MRVLVTGASGHVARTVIPRLVTSGIQVVSYDLPTGDVLDAEHLKWHAQHLDACIHLAGLKYADRAEYEPLPTVEVNVQGTANVVEAFGPRVVLASTCKAADPETVYGSSKLIAERIVLCAGGRVVRFVNVLGSRGSVTDIWAAVDGPLPVCNALRLFISDEEAAELITEAINWPTGRYGPRFPRSAWMHEIGYELYPDREQINIPLRRGDRREERLCAACERAEKWSENVVRIVGQHDPREETQKQCPSPLQSIAS